MVDGGSINTQLLVSTLMLDKRVSNIKFTRFRDACDVCRYREEACCPRCAQVQRGNGPCTPHPETSMLHKTAGFDDRPHMARWSFYSGRVFVAIGKNVRMTTEMCGWMSRQDYDDWGIWTYGERGDMRRDIHLVPMGIAALAS